MPIVTIGVVNNDTAIVTIFFPYYAKQRDSCSVITDAQLSLIFYGDLL